MKEIILNNNQERQAIWELLINKYAPAEIEKALLTLKPDMEKVVRLYYRQQIGLKEIAVIMQRSVTVIRNHSNRGIYKLYRYFNPHTFENI